MVGDNSVDNLQGYMEMHLNLYQHHYHHLPIQELPSQHDKSNQLENSKPPKGLRPLQQIQKILHDSEGILFSDPKLLI